MPTFSSSRGQGISVSASTQAQVYGLFALAISITCVGVFIGAAFAAVLLTTGMHFFLLFAELGIVFTSGMWSRMAPLNYILFLLFPLLSGITITPYILYVLIGYANGGVILVNALAATAAMTAAAAVFARTTRINLFGIGGALMMSLIGLIILGVLQIFIPSLRGGMFEMVLSGAGVIIFAGFTAYDLQRIETLGKAGANPFQLALSLYLDIFNLFLSILRFILAISGNRR